MELGSLKAKIDQTGPQRELEAILKSNQYSSGTQNRLMKLMNVIKASQNTP